MTTYSIEQKIVEDITTAIKRITVANGYPISIHESYVSDDVFSFATSNNPFDVIVQPVSSDPEDAEGRRTKNMIQWRISVVVRPESDAYSTRMTLVATIRDVIMEHPSRNEGGSPLASNTIISRTLYYVPLLKGQHFWCSDIEGACVVHHSVSNYRGQ